MNNGVLIALGLGVVAAAVVIATKKKDDNKLSRVPIGNTTFDPNSIARRSPGQPQQYDPRVFSQSVNFNG